MNLPTLRCVFRRWLYSRLCNPFRTLLTHEFLNEMLKHDTRQLQWIVSLNFAGGIRDVLTMTVTCTKLESNQGGSTAPAGDTP
jgi:hypothetical protein